MKMHRILHSAVYSSLIILEYLQALRSTHFLFLGELTFCQCWVFMTHFISVCQQREIQFRSREADWCALT